MGTVQGKGRTAPKNIGVSKAAATVMISILAQERLLSFVLSSDSMGCYVLRQRRSIYHSLAVDDAAARSTFTYEKNSEAKNGVGIKQEEKRLEEAHDFVDASSSLPVKLEANNGDAPSTIKVLKEEELLLQSVKEEVATDSGDRSSSLPIDIEAKNGDAFLITEEMKEEEEQLHMA